MKKSMNNEKDRCVMYHDEKGKFTEYIKFTPGKAVSVIHSDDPNGAMYPGKSISIDYVDDFNFADFLEYQDMTVDEFNAVLNDTIGFILNEGF